MEDRLWLILATTGYLIAVVWSAYAMGAKRPISNRWSNLLIGLAFLFHSGFLYERGQEIRHCPITNLFETIAFLSWALILTYLLIGSAYRMSILGAFTAPIVFLMNFFALITPIDQHVARPPLGWQLELHASLSVMAYGILGVSAIAGFMYLIQEKQVKSHQLGQTFYNLPAMGDLESVQQRLLAWGFVLLTFGLVAGFLIPRQGEVDWVKLVWSALVWALYLGLLLAPRVFKLSHKKLAWCCVLGYAFVLLTFWGINSLSFTHRFNS